MEYGFPCFIPSKVTLISSQRKGINYVIKFNKFFFSSRWKGRTTVPHPYPEEIHFKTPGECLKSCIVPNPIYIYI